MGLENQWCPTGLSLGATDIPVLYENEPHKELELCLNLSADDAKILRIIRYSGYPQLTET